MITYETIRHKLNLLSDQMLDVAEDMQLIETSTHIEISEIGHFVRFFSDEEKIINGNEFFYNLPS